MTRPFLGQFGQPVRVEDILKKQKLWTNSKGFFIEAGAGDGELLSNTLHFEMKYGWTGLLVEPNPDFLKKLKPKNRELLILRKCPRHFNTICIYSLGHFLISIN